MPSRRQQRPRRRDLSGAARPTAAAGATHRADRNAGTPSDHNGRRTPHTAVPADAHLAAAHPPCRRRHLENPTSSSHMQRGSDPPVSAPLTSRSTADNLRPPREEPPKASSPPSTPSQSPVRAAARRRRPPRLHQPPQLHGLRMPSGGSAPGARVPQHRRHPAAPPTAESSGHLLTPATSKHPRHPREPSPQPVPATLNPTNTRRAKKSGTDHLDSQPGPPQPQHATVLSMRRPHEWDPPELTVWK